jgi:tetratricopeptide (TPR) repeat protein
MLKFISAAGIAWLFLSLPAHAAQSGKNDRGKSETDNQIRFFQWKVSQDPDDYFNYDRLGVAYIQKARETGDVTYYDLAASALKKSLDLDSDQPESAAAKKHLATVDYAYHRFGEALALAQDAVKLNPSDVASYALIGDARAEAGDYSEAWAAYRRLRGPDVEYLKETRQSTESFLEGDTKAAIDHMRLAANISVDTHMARESIAWSYFTLGDDYFLEGDLGAAKAAYEAALKTYPDYHRALAGAAKVAAAQGRFDDAAGLYRKAIGVIPLPAYAAALGDVYTRTGNTAEARKQYSLVEYIGRLSSFNRIVYNRELSAFYADHDIHPAEALELARKEFEVRHDIYTWDALAWTLYRSNLQEEAVSAIGQALRLDTKDALLFFHAGMIYEHLDKDKSRNYLDRAMALNPQFNLLLADVAKAALQRLAQESRMKTSTRVDQNARP